MENRFKVVIDNRGKVAVSELVDGEYVEVATGRVSEIAAKFKLQKQNLTLKGKRYLWAEVLHEIGASLTNQQVPDIWSDGVSNLHGQKISQDVRYSRIESGDTAVRVTFNANSDFTSVEVCEIHPTRDLAHMGVAVYHFGTQFESTKFFFG